MEDRAALGASSSSFAVVGAGISWVKLPREVGYGSGWTSSPRLRAWQDAEVWEAMHRVLLDEAARRGQRDRSYCSIESVSVRAVTGAR